MAVPENGGISGNEDLHRVWTNHSTIPLPIPQPNANLTRGIR